MTMHPSIIGIGMTKFGRYPDRSVESIAAEAICRALEDAGIGWGDVQQVYSAHVQQGVAAGQRIMREMGATGVPVLNVENCSAAGSTAVREAVNALRVGAHDVILVVGFEKMQPGLLLNVTPSDDPQVAMGLTVLPMRYSLLAIQHMATYGSKPEHFAEISVKNHSHAVHNPYAQYPKPMSLEEVMQSRMICDPITKLQCSPVTDGATAVVMASERFVAKHGRDRAVRILASGLTSDRDLAVKNLHTTDVIERAAAAAYEAAGVGPEDIDTAEVHDCFTVAELVSYEALGFCPKGEGARLVEERSTWLGGKLPVNPGGGLLARGHPLGATGLAQMAEVVTQLRGEARGRQVDDAQVGLTYNAGVMSACVTILGR